VVCRCRTSSETGEMAQASWCRGTIDGLMVPKLRHVYKRAFRTCWLTIAMGCYVASLPACRCWLPAAAGCAVRDDGQKPLAKQEAGAGLSGWRPWLPGDASMASRTTAAPTEQWRVPATPPMGRLALLRGRVVIGKPAPGADVRAAAPQPWQSLVTPVTGPPTQAGWMGPAPPRR